MSDLQNPREIEIFDMHVATLSSFRACRTLKNIIKLSFFVAMIYPERKKYMSDAQCPSGFDPILAHQNGRCIGYTWFSIPSWRPKTAGVSDALVFAIPSWPPKMAGLSDILWHPKTAGVSDTPGFLSHLGPPKMVGVSCYTLVNCYLTELSLY